MPSGASRQRTASVAARARPPGACGRSCVSAAEHGTRGRSAALRGQEGQVATRTADAPRPGTAPPGGHDRAARGGRGHGRRGPDRSRRPPCGDRLLRARKGQIRSTRRILPAPISDRRAWPSRSGERASSASETGNEISRRRPIFPGSCPPSIFGAGELNFRVRDGNGWSLSASVTGMIFNWRATPSGPATVDWKRRFRRGSSRAVQQRARRVS